MNIRKILVPVLMLLPVPVFFSVATDRTNQVAYHDWGSVIIFSIFGGACIGLYLVPTVIAAFRNAPQFWLIFAINAAFGWTFLVWIGCLFWAATNKKQSRQVIVQNIYSTPPPPPQQNS